MSTPKIHAALMAKWERNSSKDSNISSSLNFKKYYNSNVSHSQDA